MKADKTLVIDIYLSRKWAAVLIVALVVCSLFVYLAAGQAKVAAANASAGNAAVRSALRQYYITKTSFMGNQALGGSVCATGYHFASLWEIAGTWTLQYNTSLGLTASDSGQGPTSAYSGWIRTGGPSNASHTDPVGIANCNNWSAGFGYYGTAAAPQADWSGLDTKPTFLGWRVISWDCNSALPVWCVENYTPPVWFPLIKR
jgi:hypothetical protein